MSTRTRVLVAASLVLVLAACGIPVGGGHPAGGGTPAEPFCPSLDVVNAVLGTHLGVFRREGDFQNQHDYDCVYTNADGPLMPADIEVSPDAGPGSIAKWADYHKQPITDLPGLADQAGTWTEPFGDFTSTGLIARRGNLLIIVHAFADLDHVKALAVKFFELDRPA
jgi:hypothetical protein